MKSTDNRNLFTVLIGASAASGNIRTIPATQATPGDGSASISLGYPPETFVSQEAGGIPPWGEDANGFLNLLSAAVQSLQADFFGPYNATFSAAIGGYPLNAIVSAGTAGAFWVSTAENNTSVPGASGASWQSLFSGLAPIASPVFTGTPTVPTPPAGDSSKKIANTAWVQNEIDSISANTVSPISISTTVGVAAVGDSGTVTAPSLSVPVSGWLFVTSNTEHIVGSSTTQEVGNVRLLVGTNQVASISGSANVSSALSGFLAVSAGTYAPSINITRTSGANLNAVFSVNISAFFIPATV